MTELPLAGGTANRGLVVRVGDTVRRPQGPGQDAVHALLRHLEDVGFDGAPRFLGVDEQQREVLSYVPGEVALPPYPPWALTPEALRSVAELLRRYHDAVATFDVGEHTWRRALPERFRGDLISHNDPNLDNVVFRGGRAVALIDFDLAAPGSRAWDVAAAARTWVPLRPPGDIPDPREAGVWERFRSFVDDSALPDAERDLVVDALLEERGWMYDIVRDGVREGTPGFVFAWTSEAAARDERARQWCTAHEAQLRAALG